MALKIGDIIRNRMEEIHYPQKLLAEKLHISPKTVKSILDAENLSVIRLIDVSLLLDYNFLEVYTRPDAPLQQFAKPSSEETKQENADLKAKIIELEASIVRLESKIEYKDIEIRHQKELLDILKQTLDVQQIYFKNLDAKKDS